MKAMLPGRLPAMSSGSIIDIISRGAEHDTKDNIHQWEKGFVTPGFLSPCYERRECKRLPGFSLQGHGPPIRVGWGAGLASQLLSTWTSARTGCSARMMDGRQNGWMAWTTSLPLQSGICQRGGILPWEIEITSRAEMQAWLTGPHGRPLWQSFLLPLYPGN